MTYLIRRLGWLSAVALFMGRSALADECWPGTGPPILGRCPYRGDQPIRLGATEAEVKAEDPGGPQRTLTVRFDGKDLCHRAQPQVVWERDGKTVARWPLAAQGRSAGACVFQGALPDGTYQAELVGAPDGIEDLAVNPISRAAFIGEVEWKGRTAHELPVTVQPFRATFTLDGRPLRCPSPSKEERGLAIGPELVLKPRGISISPRCDAKGLWEARATLLRTAEPWSLQLWQPHRLSAELPAMEFTFREKVGPEERFPLALEVPVPSTPIEVEWLGAEKCRGANPKGPAFTLQWVRTGDPLGRLNEKSHLEIKTWLMKGDPDRLKQAVTFPCQGLGRKTTRALRLLPGEYQVWVANQNLHPDGWGYAKMGDYEPIGTQSVVSDGRPIALRVDLQDFRVRIALPAMDATPASAPMDLPLVLWTPSTGEWIALSVKQLGENEIEAAGLVSSGRVMLTIKQNREREKTAEPWRSSAQESHSDEWRFESSHEVEWKPGSTAALSVKDWRQDVSLSVDARLEGVSVCDRPQTAQGSHFVFEDIEQIKRPARCEQGRFRLEDRLPQGTYRVSLRAPAPSGEMVADLGKMALGANRVVEEKKVDWVEARFEIRRTAFPDSLTNLFAKSFYSRRQQPRLKLVSGSSTHEAAELATHGTVWLPAGSYRASWSDGKQSFELSPELKAEKKAQHVLTLTTRPLIIEFHRPTDPCAGAAKTVTPFKVVASRPGYSVTHLAYCDGRRPVRLEGQLPPGDWELLVYQRQPTARDGWEQVEVTTLLVMGERSAE